MMELIRQKIKTVTEAQRIISAWHINSQKMIFTNGCFDLIHPGHLQYLAEAKSLGNRLIIGLNSDASVKRLKGEHRPIMDQNARALLLASLLFVDMVVLFEEDTPLELIKALNIDILVKGGDYTIEDIVGSKEVLAKGGAVQVLSFLSGYSTSSIEKKINTGQ